MNRTAQFFLLTMLIAIPSNLIAKDPDHGQVATPVPDVTSPTPKIPPDRAPHVSVAVSDMSLPAFVAGVELLLARDKELARELVIAVDRNNRSQHAQLRILVTQDSSMSITDFEQLIRIAIADNARLARALIGGQPGNE